MQGGPAPDRSRSSRTRPDSWSLDPEPLARNEPAGNRRAAHRVEEPSRGTQSPSRRGGNRRRGESSEIQDASLAEAGVLLPDVLERLPVPLPATGPRPSSRGTPGSVVGDDDLGHRTGSLGQRREHDLERLAATGASRSRHSSSDCSRRELREERRCVERHAFSVPVPVLFRVRSRGAPCRLPPSQRPAAARAGSAP